MLRTRVATNALRPLSRGVATSAPRALATHASDSHVVKAKAWENPFPADTFSVGPKNGFLPVKDPLETLPQEYEAMETLLEDMRLQKKDGTPGLLATGDFGAAVERDLPEYDISKVNDGELLSGECFSGAALNPALRWLGSWC